MAAIGPFEPKPAKGASPGFHPHNTTVVLPPLVPLRGEEGRLSASVAQEELGPTISLHVVPGALMIKRPPPPLNDEERGGEPAKPRPRQREEGVQRPRRRATALAQRTHEPEDNVLMLRPQHRGGEEGRIGHRPPKSKIKGALGHGGGLGKSYGE